MVNTLKVGVLLAVLTAFLIWIGQIIGQAAGIGGTAGMVIAFVFAMAMNFGSYWFSDKLVLRAVRAQELDERSAPELYAMVRRLAERAAIPAPRLYLVPDPTPNAFATGRSPKHGVVAVNQGLLNMLSQEEVEGVIAHEIAHIRHRDTLTMAVVATVAGAIMIIANILQWTAFLFPGGQSEDGGPSVHPIALLGIALVAPIAATLIQLAVSRAREFEADRAAASYVGSGRGLKNALLKLERGSAMLPATVPMNRAHMYISNPLKGRGLMNLFRTHPSTEDRVKKLEEFEMQARRSA